MTNRPKKIGTAGESAVVKFLREMHSFPEKRIRRMTLAGAYDLGDVHAEFPDGSLLCIEVKAGKQADDASLNDIAAWQREADDEARNSNTPHRMLVVKRRATSSERVAFWRAFIPLLLPQSDGEIWVEMPLYSAMVWLNQMHGVYPRSILAA